MCVWKKHSVQCWRNLGLVLWGRKGLWKMQKNLKIVHQCTWILSRTWNSYLTWVGAPNQSRTVVLSAIFIIDWCAIHAYKVVLPVPGCLSSVPRPKSLLVVINGEEPHENSKIDRKIWKRLSFERQDLWKLIHAELWTSKIRMEYNDTEIWGPGRIQWRNQFVFGSKELWCKELHSIGSIYFLELTRS